MDNSNTDHNLCIPLVAAIDVGTTSSRVILFNKFGQEVTKHQVEYSTSASKEKANQFKNEDNNTLKSQPIFSNEGIAITPNNFLKIEGLETDDEPTLRFPKPGWVECNPLNILFHVVQCFATVLTSLNQINKERINNRLPSYQIKCIGIANMRETTLVWSKTSGLPLCEYGIVWNDIRTADIVNEKKNNTSLDYQEYLREMTGLPVLSTYFSCSKLRWLIDNVQAVSIAYTTGDLMFGTVDTWLIYHLTSNHAFVSDITNASRTGFMNLSTLQYDDELLKYWDIDKDKVHLPKIVSSAEYYGDFAVPFFIQKRLTHQAQTILTEFNHNYPCIPIQGCLGDQSASLVGQLAFKPGSAKCTYGTGCFLLYNTGTKKLISQHGALTTFGYWFPHLEDQEQCLPHFALEGSVAVAGSVVQWLRDNLRLFPKAEDVGPLASRVPDSGGVVFVPAFSGLFAPYWDPDARATIMGMSQYTTASHIARAAIEGVCFQARAILKAMCSDVVNKGQEDKEFMGDISDDNCATNVLSVLAVDGGMSRSGEVMQIQADILGPCVKVRRSPSSECTALGAAIAAALAFKNPNDRDIWKDLNDVKRWVLYHGIDKNDITKQAPSTLQVFSSKLTDLERRRRWKLWETAVKRSQGWIAEASYLETK